MNEVYGDDLLEFVRYGKLDGYELTDDELGQLLEVWRWSVWTRRRMPSGPDYDVLEATRQLQRRLARNHNIEVDYNTALLLKQEIEPLMHLRVLLDLPRAILYFISFGGLRALLKSIWEARRYRDVTPMLDHQSGVTGYPAAAMDVMREKAPDVLKRPYWRQLSPYSFEERKRLDYWW